MRRTLPIKERHFTLRKCLKLWAVVLIAAVLLFNTYVDTEIRPTLMELAEYEARAVTLQTIHTAVSRTMGQMETDCAALYEESEHTVQMNTAVANRLRSTLIQAIQTEMQELPEQEYTIPFGSLTGNSLLNGHGPGWQVTLKPEGYIQAQWQEQTESLSINTTRYSASLALSVTVNMILDGRTETLTVTDSVPLASVLLCGETPSAYAAALD